MSGADSVELAAVAHAAHIWPTPEPLSEEQGADIAALLRDSRQGRATDLLMARLGFRQVAPLRPGPTT